jgi:TolB-like protein
MGGHQALDAAARYPAFNVTILYLGPLNVSQANYSNGATQVFISYASPDGTAANEVCAHLEQAGLTCWLAPRNVVPGEFYADAIVHAIDAAKVLVLILSKNSAASAHVLREVERAGSKRLAIVALRLDLAPLPAALEYFLNTSHWLDASNIGVCAALPKVAAAVQHLLSAPLSTIKSEPRAESAGDRSKAARWIGALAGSLILALALGYFVNDRFRQHTYSPQPENVTSAAAPSNPVPAFAPPAHSIAVLPFVNMSGDPKQDYFSDGLSEELLNSLASIRDLHVAARTSSFSFKGKNTDVADIARKLNVGAVLEGSLRKDGGRIRITAQLIDAITGFHLWSQTFDRDLKNVLMLQSEIATSVTKALQSALLADASAAVELGGTRDPRAFDAYLHAQGIKVIDKESNLAELAAFDEAIRLDPGYAKAYAGKAGSLGGFAGSYESAANARHVAEQAHALAEKAVRLAPNLAEAHMALAFSFDVSLLDFAHGMEEYERAQSLAPGDSRVLRGYSDFLSRMGRAEEAIAGTKPMPRPSSQS